MKTTSQINPLRRWSLLLAFALPLALVSACDDDETPAPQNEEEFIPEVRINFYTGATTTGTPVATLLATTNANGSVVINPATATLTRGQQYTYTVAFGDDELNEEIGDEEADEHRFFILLPATQEVNFAAGSFPRVPAFGFGGTNYTVSLPASDDDNGAAAGGCPIGLTGTFTVPSITPAGTVNIPVVAVLRHQPDAKECATNAAGNPTAGSSDAEVAFTISVN